MYIDLLPPLNAVLNALSAILLVFGYGAIKRGEKQAHKKYMLSALTASILFLISYLWYHAHVGHVPFEGQGWSRPVYFVILITHSLLAAAVPAFANYLLIMAYGGRFDKHKAAARYAFPVWMYVNLTGIVIYLMLYHWPVPEVNGQF